MDDPSDPPANGETLASFSKRQRRPSVRLGDIGEQPAAIPYEPYVRRSKHYKPSPTAVAAAVTAADEDPPKIRHLAPKDLPPADDRALAPAADETLQPLAAIRRPSRDGKSRKAGGRRIRSAWASKIDEGVESADHKSSGDDGYGDYVEERNDGVPTTAPPARARVSDGGPAVDAAEGDAPSETGGGERDEHGEGDGVRNWLDGMGLGRYAPVFEIHEVDAEVLPLLTLDDLKDMGINAVGTRRKMYCAIQKLGGAV